MKHISFNIMTNSTQDRSRTKGLLNMKCSAAFFAMLLAVLFLFGSAGAESEKEYRLTMEMPDMPALLNVGTTLECGSLSFRLMGQPVVTPSTTGLKATEDNSFLIIRAGIKNNSDEPLFWMDPDSFHAQEYYLNVLGRNYGLNTPMSAKVAGSFSVPPFFSPIRPGTELSTILVFEVCGDADGWIFTFSPYTREKTGPADTVSFTLPKVTRQ